MHKRLATIMFALLILLITGTVYADQSAITRATVNQALTNWPAHPRQAAEKLIGQYGLPDEVTPTMLTWLNNGVWKRTVVYRDVVPHDFPKPHTDFVEQFIDYRVPPDKMDDLALFDGSVIVERTKGEVSVRCDKEAMNFLALNLANDIVNGNKTVDQARKFYTDTAMVIMEGEKPSYTLALQFSPGGSTADVDVTIIPQSVLSSLPADTPSRPGSEISVNVNRLKVTSSSIDNILASWPSHPRDAATMLIEKYGLPNEATPSMLTWFNNGTWKRTIVYRDEIAHHFPKPHTDFVEQFINYRVPADKFDDLAAYDGSVIAERTKGEISARCDKEEMNLLALNLANDIVKGTRNVEQARQFYADTAVAAMKGDRPAYITGLQFTRPIAVTADRDVSTIPAAMVSSLTETTEQTTETTRRLSKD